MATKARTSLTSLERLERQLQAITPDRAQGDAWEKALKSWITGSILVALSAGSTALETRCLGN